MPGILLLLLSLTFPLLAAVTLPTEGTSVIPAVPDGPAKSAIEIFQNGQHKEAVNAATPLAKDGDADALFLLGFASETGQGLDPSREKALKYYGQAADAGNKEANYRRALILLNSENNDDRQLGRMTLEKSAEEDKGAASRMLGEAWLRGLLSEKPDPDKAIIWWTNSMNAGDSTAAILLARLRSGAFGFPEKADTGIALDLYRKAAEMDDPRAYVPLGSSLLNGEESLRDEGKGRKWLEKAIEQKQYDAYLALGDYEQVISKDDKAAFQTYLKGAENKQPECMYRAAALLFQGKGTQASPSKAREWLNKASEAGHGLAALELATLLSKDTPSKPSDIYTQLIIASKSGLPQAQNELGLFYLSGTLGIADPKAAISWLTDAAKAGFAAAQHNLGILFETGVGVPVDYNNAGELYSLAANQKHPEATAALARMHAQGKGTTRDLARAFALATLAQERGDKSSRELLDQLTTLLDSEGKAKAQTILKELKEAPATQPGK